MSALRSILIVINGICLAVIAFTAIVEGSHTSGYAVIFLFAIGAPLFANFMYLLNVRPDGQPTKALELFRLWTSAKESELRRRATAAGSPRTGASAAFQDRN